MATPESSPQRLLTIPPLEPRLRILCQKAKGWGARILLVGRDRFEEVKDQDGFSDSPFSRFDLGVDYRRKIVYTGIALKDRAPFEEVIHELGHVVACLKEPGESDEIDFLGWEYALAKELRGVRAWLSSNKNYAVGDQFGTGVDELGELSSRKRQTVLNNCLAEARAQGLVTRDGFAQAIR